jgi:hypothetical protein
VTVAWRTDEEVAAGIEVGPPAPEEAQIVDEATARAVFERVIREGNAAFDSSTGDPVQLLPPAGKKLVEFPATAWLLETVPMIVGG